MSNKIRNHIYAQIEKEREYQNYKYGEQELPPFMWLAILVQWLGKTAEAISSGDQQKMSRRLVQLAALSVRILESHGTMVMRSALTDTNLDEEDWEDG